MNRFLCTLLAVLWLVLATAGRAAAAEPANLVANGDFAQVANGQPAQWQVAGDEAYVAQMLRAGRDAQGRPCAELVCTRCEARNGSCHAMLAQVGVVQLVKGRTYEFSCRARAQGMASRTVSVGISDTKTWANCGLLDQVPLAEAWAEHRCVFRATRDVAAASSRLQIWFNEPGTLSIADVRLVEFQPGAAEFTDVVAPAGGRNLVVNGAFEVGAAGWSSLGTPAGWGNLDCLHGHIEPTGGSGGGAFLRIPLGGDQTPVLCFDYYEPVVRPQWRALAASRGWIRLTPGAAYTLSCDLRASVEGTPALLGVRLRDPDGASRDEERPVQLTMAWKRYALTFRPRQRYAFVFAGPALEREARVDVDVDNVQLEQAEQAGAFAPRAEVEFGMEPGADGGIFTAGEPAVLRVRVCNHSAAAQRATVSFRATDFEDRPVPLAELTVDLPARTTVARDVPLPADWRGYYRVAAAGTAGGRAEAALVRLAIVPARPSRDSVCGINHAFASARLVRLAAKVGMGWSRDWSLKWQHLEPAPGQFHWEVGDAQIDRVLRAGVSVLPLLPPFPSADWASAAPADLPRTGYPGVRLRQAWGPRDPRALAAFIEAAARHYRDRIHIWEFLNEPIYTDYALPADAANQYHGPHYTAADYVALLAPAAAAMRQADPECQVIGGIAGGPRTLTRDVLEAGILKHVDIFNLHIYPGARAPETFAGEMDELLALMDAHGGRKPIWITEFSYYGADEPPTRPFLPGPGDWAGPRLLASERQLADYTVRFVAVMQAHGVRKVFLHSGASGEVNHPSLECALFDYGGVPRKLAPALAVFTELLGGAPTCAGHGRFGTGGHAVAFETGPRAVLMLWQEQAGPGPNPAAGATDATAWRDIMGRTLPAAPTALSTSPVYLLAPAGRAPALLRAVTAPQ